MRSLTIGAWLVAAMACPATAQELVEPAAREVLERMGTHLTGLQAYELTADTGMEIVLDTDQKLLVGGTAVYHVRQPNRLKVELRTDVAQREFFFDGTSATYVSPGDGFYAQVADAPATIGEMLEHAAQRHGLAFPVADLLAWNSGAEWMGRITEGFRVGQTRIGDVVADHWAYRIDNQDLELWIPVEGSPLPLRISTVDRQDLTHPRFTATLSWNEAADPADAIFSFTPAEGMTAIPLASTDLAVEAPR